METCENGQVALESGSYQHNCVGSRFKDRDYCDVRVTGPGGIVVHCSRFALRRSSDVMSRVIGTSCTSFHISRGDPDAVVWMLKYMHGSACILTAQLVPRILSLAEMYNVKELIEKCRRFSAERESPLNNQTANCGDRDGNVPDEAAKWKIQGLDPTRCVREADFMNYSIGQVEETVESALPKMFLLASFSRYYGIVVKLVIAWLEYDFGTRRSFSNKLLGQLEFEYLEESDLLEIMGSSAVRTIPGLLQKISISERTQPLWPKTIYEPGRSQWTVPSSGNYFIVTRGGSGNSCPDCKETGVGGKGLVVAGTFYLESGSQLTIQIAHQKPCSRGLRLGGSSSCVGIRCTKQESLSSGLKEKIHVLLVAAGGGAAGGCGWGMVNGEDAKPSDCLEGQPNPNSCSCPLRGMSVTPKQLEEKVLQNANGKMGMPYHPQPGLAGMSYLSKDAKGTYCCCGDGQSQPSVSIYSRPSYL